MTLFDRGFVHYQVITWRYSILYFQPWKDVLCWYLNFSCCLSNRYLEHLDAINCSNLNDITERSINSCAPWKNKVLFKRRSETDHCGAPSTHFLSKARTQQADQHNSMNRINSTPALLECARDPETRPQNQRRGRLHQATRMRDKEKDMTNEGNTGSGANDDKTDRMKTIGVYESRWEGKGMRQLCSIQSCREMKR